MLCLLSALFLDLDNLTPYLMSMKSGRGPIKQPCHVMAFLWGVSATL
jgi:hypothetical protein